TSRFSFVSRPIDFAHSAFAEQRRDLVRTELLSDRDRHRAGELFRLDLLLLFPLPSPLSPLLFNSVQTLGLSVQKLCPFSADEFTKEHSVGTSMGRVTSDCDPLARLDGIGRPADIGE